MSSPNYAFSEIANQAAAQVLLNNNTNILDCLLHLKIKDRDLTAPPGSPADGDVYLPKAAATGVWTGKEGLLACYLSGWFFITPQEGCRGWVMDEDIEIVYDGAAWRPLLSTVSFGLTDGATINTDASTGNLFFVTLGGNRTMAAPTNPAPWQKILYVIKQDGTGSRLLTWNAAFRFPGGIAPTLTATLDKTDYVSFMYNDNDNVWDNIGANFNF